MTDSNFHRCLVFTLEQEGGFSDDPQDSGGPTYRGITLVAYRAFVRNPQFTADQLRALPDDMISDFYHDCYWNPVRGDDLPLGVDLMVFDEGVNTGPGISARLLQECVGLTGWAVDGVIGPKTLAAVAERKPAILIQMLTERQSIYYRTLEGFARFGDGWLARVERRCHVALAMATNKDAYV